jgi:hypothetical protein
LRLGRSIIAGAEGGIIVDFMEILTNIEIFFEGGVMVYQLFLSLVIVVFFGIWLFGEIRDILISMLSIFTDPRENK